MNKIFVSTALVIMSLSVCVAAAKSPPKGVFTLTELEQAKTQAAENKQPLIFVVTDLDSNCGLCVSATADIFRSFRSVGTLVHIVNKTAEINKAPVAVRQMYSDPAARGAIPLALVSTADASKSIKVFSYNALKGGNAGKLARSFAKELETIDVQGAPKVPVDDAASDTGPKLLAAEQAWENSQGRQITAAVKNVENGRVIFVMNDGKEVSYPIEQLSDASRKKIEDLTDP